MKKDTSNGESDQTTVIAASTVTSAVMLTLVVAVIIIVAVVVNRRFAPSKVVLQVTSDSGTVPSSIIIHKYINCYTFPLSIECLINK